MVGKLTRPASADGLIAGGLLPALFLLYLATIGRSPLCDGVYYCVEITSRDPVQFLHGAHLLYGTVGYLFHFFLSGLFPMISVWRSLLVLSALSGAACVSLFYYGCRRVGIGAVTALSCALLLAVSIEFWRHASNVEYIVPNALVVCGFFVAAVRCLHTPRPRRGWVLGALFGLAVLAHARHALLLPVVMVVALSSGDPWRTLGRSLGAAVALVASAYGVAGWVVFGNPGSRETILWAGGHWLGVGGGEASPWWVWRTRNLLWMPIWQLGAVVDAAHLRHLLWARDRFQSLYPILAALVVSLASGAGVTVLARFFWSARRERVLIGALVLWLAVYGLFFSFWCPSEEAWWVVGLIPLWALVGLGLDTWGGGIGRFLRTAAVVTLVLAVAGLNLWGGHGVLAAHRHIEPQLGHLFRLARDARPGDMVLWLGYLWPRAFGPDCRDVRPGIWDNPQGLSQARFFTPARSFGTLEVRHHSEGIRAEAFLTTAAGRTVWLSLAEGTLDRTLERTRGFDPPSASAIRRVLEGFELAPTGNEGLWTLAPLQPPIDDGAAGGTRRP